MIVKIGAKPTVRYDLNNPNEKKYYELLEDYWYWREKILTYVREEKGQVFFYVQNCDKEYLMYDFNLKVGDEVYLVDPLYFLSYNFNNHCELTEDEMNSYKCGSTIFCVEGVPLQYEKSRRDIGKDIVANRFQVEDIRS
jgi:hypothetical protein